METNGKMTFIKAGETRVNLSALMALKYRPPRVHPLSASFGSIPADYVAYLSNGTELELTKTEGEAVLAVLDTFGANNR